MYLGSKVHHGINLFVIEEEGDQVRALDLSLYELHRVSGVSGQVRNSTAQASCTIAGTHLVICLSLHALQVPQACAVVELVQHNHLRVQAAC